MKKDKDNEYYSCKYLHRGINFHTYNISTCNFWTKGLIFNKLNESDGKE